MQSALSVLQPPPALPPSSSLSIYEGYYGIGNVKVLYVYFNDSIPAMMLAGSSYVILQWRGDDVFQIEMPSWISIPCQTSYLLAANYQYVYFQVENGAESASSVSIPGLIPMATFQKIK